MVNKLKVVFDEFFTHPELLPAEFREASVAIVERFSGAQLIAASFDHLAMLVTDCHILMQGQDQSRVGQFLLDDSEVFKP